MNTNPPKGSNKPSAYGSAKDLPTYKEMSQQIQGLKLLTRVIARDQRQKLLEIEEQMERLTRVVDDFYDRLGSRNWIFHDTLNVDKIEQLIAETADAESAEIRLIDLYRDREEAKRWHMLLRSHEGLRKRLHLIERAREHYDADQFDSCVLQLIAIMDGFVNDVEPEARKGLHARNPDDMAAWDSAVGHHMGLTHALATFTKTFKKRVDEEVFDVYRHGIMHGTVVNFDNVVVATKAWNMLFAVADWATATHKAAEPNISAPSIRDTWKSISRHALYKKYQQEFVPSTIESSDSGFSSNEIMLLASEFLDAWEHGRWGIVARFKPPILCESKSDGYTAREAKTTFEPYDLKDWSIKSITYDQASSVEIMAQATVNNQVTEMRFRIVFWSVDGNVAIPDREEGDWSLAVWAPNTYLKVAAE
jgi:hypothetical protein